LAKISKIETIRESDMNQENHPLATRIGQHLRLLRLQNRITQKDIAYIMNISPQQIHKYESGKNLIPLNHLAILQDHFSISIDEWLSDFALQNSIAYDPKIHFYAHKMNEWLNK
jgi:transcriptional regulator with XRE-family HTH domain